MARPIEQELYRSLMESQLNFIQRDIIEIDEIYDEVQLNFPNLCDDAYLCSENCSNGNNQPEWKHTVRKVLDRLKNTTNSVHKFGIPKYWEFI